MLIDVKLDNNIKKRASYRKIGQVWCRGARWAKFFIDDIADIYTRGRVNSFMQIGLQALA